MNLKLITLLFGILLQVLICVPILLWLKPPIFASFSLCVLIAVVVDNAFTLYTLKVKMGKVE